MDSSILKKVLRGFSISVALKVARLLINLVLVSFLARFIGQEGFGHLMVTMALVGVLLCFVEFGTQGIVQRDLVHEEGQWMTVGSVFFTRLTTGALCYAGLLMYVLIAPQGEKPLLMIYGSLLLTHAGTVFMSWLLARHHLEPVAWAQFLGFIASAVAIVGGLFFRAPLWYFAVTYVLECWIVTAISVVMFCRCGGSFRLWRWSKSRTTALLRESWFELASQLALLLLFRLDTIMVEAMRGASDAGIYGAAVRVSEVVYFLPATLGTACLTALVGLRSRDPLRYRRRVAEYFALSVVLAATCATLLALAAPFLIVVLFGKNFNGLRPHLGSARLGIHPVRHRDGPHGVFHCRREAVGKSAFGCSRGDLECCAELDLDSALRRSGCCVGHLGCLLCGMGAQLVCFARWA